MDDLIRHLGLTNQTLLVQGDVSDPKYVGEMFEQIEKEFGRIDVLYNNAGVSGPVVFGSAYEEGHFDEYREARTTCRELSEDCRMDCEGAF